MCCLKPPLKKEPKGTFHIIINLYYVIYIIIYNNCILYYYNY